MGQRFGFCDCRMVKDDSRIFFYKDPERKWKGVVVNLAHSKAWKFLGWTVVPAILFPIAVLGLWRGTNPALFWKVFGILSALYVAYCSATCIYAFRMAAKEEKNENRYWKH